MDKEISPEREAELLDILLKEIHKRSLKETIQVYPACRCGGHVHTSSSEYEFHPQKKGIIVKVGMCVCGRKIFPDVEWIS